MSEHNPVNGKSFKKRLDFLVFVALMISATVFIASAALQRSKVEALESLGFLEVKEFGLPGYLIVDVTDLLIPDGDIGAIGPLPDGSGAIKQHPYELRPDA